MKTLVATFLVVMLVGATAPVFAQTGTATPKVTKRQMVQQKRIRQGVKSGELTKGEAAKLEKGEKKIQAEKKAMKADGKVTPQERAKLHRDLNKESRAIKRLKHNKRTR